MVEQDKYFYVYTEPKEGFPDQYENVIALVVNGRRVETFVGLSEEVIGVRARAAYVNNFTMILNRHPNGKETSVKLDSDLVKKLKSIGGWDIP